MPDAATILARVRSRGANVALDDGELTIVNGRKLPAGAAAFIAEHRAALIRHLAAEDEGIEEAAAVIEFDGHAPREWAEQFAAILIRTRPAGVADADWSWFITRCGQIIDETPARAA